MTPEERRIKEALKIANNYGGIDGDHHKMWTIDQMVRALTNCPLVEVHKLDYKGNPFTYKTFGESEEYKQWIVDHNKGEDGPNTYEWEKGIAP